MSEYKIEVAAPQDFLSIAALDRIAWPDAPDTFIPDGEHVWRVWCEYAVVLIARPSSDTASLESDCAAGALVMFPTVAGEMFLHKIMVHPSCRGAGIGTALMQSALRRAASTVLLTVDPQNSPAVRLYEGFGFYVREKCDGFYRPHEDRYLMEYYGTSLA